MAQVQLQCRRTAFAVVAALRLCQVLAPASRHAVLDARVGLVVQSTWCIRSLEGFSHSILVSPHDVRIRRGFAFVSSVGARVAARSARCSRWLSRTVNLVY